MSQSQKTVITLGLCQIKVGEVVKDENTGDATGAMPQSMVKIGKTYKDTAKIGQDASDVTEHFEEGHSAPEVRKKSKKIPKVTFSIMNPDPTMLAAYIGGDVDATSGAWLFDGDEVVANKAITVETEQGLDFEIPNGDIEAVINGDLSTSGIVLVDFTVTPCAVSDSAKKAIHRSQALKRIRRRKSYIQKQRKPQDPVFSGLSS